MYLQQMLLNIVLNFLFFIIIYFSLLLKSLKDKKILVLNLYTTIKLIINMAKKNVSF